MRFFRNWWLVTTSCALLLALLFAFGLPLVIGFFRPLWIRVSFVLLVAAIWGLLVFLHRRKAKRAAEAIAAELAPPDAANEEEKSLAGRVRDALAQLRAASGTRDYLYTRPWYVIIGPPGAGKTTALLNSGLRFPFGDQALSGVGGTRNLDFWFADEAVMIDTAGRYTTQDSDHRVDSAGWNGLLRLLKRHRPLQPINGIIVAIGVDELIARDCAGIDAHARAIRRRLAEVRATLEMAAPVYVMLTKADRLSGFIEYFADLDVEGRRAVSGTTLPFSGERPGSAMLARAFDEMVQAISDRQAKRLYEEVDARRRSLLLGFPVQLLSLRARLMRFLDGVFVTADEPAGRLRGFYLTSGTQEGAPLDRILSSVAEVYDRVPEAVPGPARAGSGRAYFLNRLLTEVLFPEAGLGTMDSKARMRVRGQLAGAFAGIAAVCVSMLILWSVSFAQNRGFQHDMLVKATAAHEELKQRGIDARQVRESDAPLSDVLPVLDQLRDFPQGFAYLKRNGGPPLMMTFGLYQTGLAESAREAYRDGLRRLLLPRIMLRLEQYIAANGNEPMLLFEPLKAYLLLGGRHAMDADSVRAWVTADWATGLLAGADSAAERAALTRHLDALLDDRDIAAAWPDRRAPLDGDLVARARDELGTLDPSQRAYALLKQRAANPDKDWLLATHLNPGEATAFGHPESLLVLRVPYFFTREGYEKSYLVGRGMIERTFVQDYWVFDENADTARAKAEARNVKSGIAGQYASDYVAAWEGVIDALQPVDYFDPANRSAFGALTRSPSPLKKILLEVRRNTSFKGGMSAAISRGIETQISRSRAGGYIRDMRNDRVEGLDAGSEIAGRFVQLNEFVGDGKNPGGVDRFVNALEKAVSASFAADPNRMIGASQGNTDLLASANSELLTAGSDPPELLRPFMEAAAGRAAHVQVEIEAGAVSSAYIKDVLPDCREVTEDHYPFDRQARDNVSVSDADRVFGREGTIDRFLTQLRPLMLGGPIPRWNTENHVAATLNPESPAQFAKANAIRDLINVGLPLEVSLFGAGSGVTSVDITSNDTSRSFSSKADPPQALQWSLRGLQQASVVLHTTGGEIRIADSGPWALFRVIERATERTNDGSAIRFTFGAGANWATLRIGLPSPVDPFIRTGLWSFRCPSVL